MNESDIFEDSVDPDMHSNSHKVMKDSYEEYDLVQSVHDDLKKYVDFYCLPFLTYFDEDGWEIFIHRVRNLKK